MLSWVFRQLDILRLGYLIDRCCVVWHFWAVLDLRKWYTEPIKEMLVSLKQCHSTVRHNNGPVSGSAINWPIKQTSLKKASLSLSRQLCKWNLGMSGRKLQDNSQLHNNVPDYMQRLCWGALLPFRLRRAWRLCSLFTAMWCFLFRDKEMRNSSWPYLHTVESTYNGGKK